MCHQREAYQTQSRMFKLKAYRSVVSWWEAPQKAPLRCQHTRQFRACSRAGCWVVTESDNTLLAVQHNACACGCLLTGRGEYPGEDSFKNSLVSIPVVVIYYIYLFHHLLLSFSLTIAGGEAGFPLGRVRTPTEGVQPLPGVSAITTAPLVVAWHS